MHSNYTLSGGPRQVTGYYIQGVYVRKLENGQFEAPYVVDLSGQQRPVVFKTLKAVKEYAKGLKMVLR